MGKDFVAESSGVTSPLRTFVVPALRKVREGRGTHRIADINEIKRPGHPPGVDGVSDQDRKVVGKTQGEGKAAKNGTEDGSRGPGVLIT